MPRSHRLTSIHVRPPPHDVDPVKNTRFRDDHGINPETVQRLKSRAPSGQFAMLDVVRKIVVSVFPAMLDALVVQHLNIVIEADA
jgi:hypothetical protein